MALIKGMFCTDQHNLHPRAPTHHVLSTLTELHYNQQPIKEFNWIVYGGDFYDQLVEANDPNLHLTHRWVKRFTSDLDKYKVYFDYVEGTTSHDRGQTECFDILKPKGSPYIDYIKTMKLKYYKDFGIWCLYIPDNYGKKPKKEIYDEAVALMAEYNLTQVHFIFIHGGFDFQYHRSAVTDHTAYDSSAWSKLAIFAIFNGHVHTRKEKDNIYGTGSWGRYRFGEMEPKGCHIFEFDVETNYFKVDFIENKQTLRFDTIQLSSDLDQRAVIKILNKYLDKGIERGSSIRLQGGKASVVNPVVLEFTTMYPDYYFEADNLTDKGQVSNAEKYDPSKLKRVSLTRENIIDNLSSYAINNNKIPDDIDFEFAKNLLKEVMDKGRR